MDNYKDKNIREIFRIKDNVESVGFAFPETVNQLLSLFVRNEIYIEKLEKQLDYALLTGGEYLEVNPCVN